MTIENSLITLEEDTKNANTIKELILTKLCTDGHISEEIKEEYSTVYNVVIIKRDWFTRWANSLMGNKTGWAYKYIKF